MFVKNKKPNSDNYRTPLHSSSCVATGDQARVTSFSPAGTENFHIPITPIAFPLIGSKAEKSVA